MGKRWRWRFARDRIAELDSQTSKPLGADKSVPRGFVFSWSNPERLHPAERPPLQYGIAYGDLHITFLTIEEDRVFMGYIVRATFVP